jgi:transcriptional regulator with XRE-family HTH domain
MDVATTHVLIARRFLQELDKFTTITGLSPAALSLRTGVPAVTIRSWKYRKSSPRKTTIRKVAHNLGLDVGFIFEGTKPTPPTYLRTDWPLMSKALKQYTYFATKDLYADADNVLGQIALMLFNYLSYFGIPVRLCSYGGGGGIRHTIRVDFSYVSPAGGNFLIRLCGNGKQAWVFCEALHGHIPYESQEAPRQSRDTRVLFEGPLSTTFVKFAIKHFCSSKAECEDALKEMIKEQEAFAMQADNSESEI